jgi:NADPH-dependent 2,4-dienoyl-CoA reductase/sulfur reductase-like enzyme
MSEPLVVVGASVAGIRLVGTLRRYGVQTRIVVVDAEGGDPYDKPQLSKQLLLDERPTVQTLATTSSLARDRIELRMSCPATGLDPEAHVLELNGRPLPYSQLVLACGSRPRTLPSFDGVAGVLTLRTHRDAVALRTALRDRPQVAVIGGGLIGCEVAAAARALGAPVVMLEAGERLAGRVLAPEPAERLRMLHEEHGAEVRLQAAVTRARTQPIDGVERLTGIELSDGTTVPAELAIVGIGTNPVTHWLDGCGMRIAEGVCCDAALRAQDVTDIWAIGDVARWWNNDLAEYVRFEHWTGAREQAAFVAKALAGRETTSFRPIPYVWSDQYAVHIQHAGTTDGADQVEYVGNGARGRYTFSREGQVIGVTGFDDPAGVLAVRRSFRR